MSEEIERFFRAISAPKEFDYGAFAFMFVKQYGWTQEQIDKTEIPFLLDIANRELEFFEKQKELTKTKQY